MKTQATTVFVKQGHVFQFEVYLDQYDLPKVTQHEGRRDMPATCFAAEEGDFWIKTSEIVAIHYGVTTTYPASGNLGH